MSKKLRIDYVIDNILDVPTFYSYYLGTTEIFVGNEIRQTPNSPSLAFWKDFLRIRAGGPPGIYTEFNYITEPSTAGLKFCT